MVDGGAVQKTVAERTVLHLMLNTKVVAVVKNAKHKPDHIMGEPSIIRDHHHDILAINAEAHRFAIAYHRLLRGKELK